MSFPTEPAPWRLEWTDELSVCIPEIDAEHRHFIRLVNELNDAILRRMDLAEVRKRLQAILDDARTHFEHEERLFTEWGYPEAEAHAQKHAQILQTLHEMMESATNATREYEWIDTGLKIKQILIDHLLNEDMKYRDHRHKNP